MYTSKIFEAKKIVRVRNPQGTITDEAEAAVRTALKEKEYTHIVVDGEEDLLIPVAVLHAPENALIIYGQPYQGVVVVKATAEKRVQAKELLDLMACSKAK